MNPLQSLAEYELFIYTLSQRYPVIVRSTLVVVRRGPGVAIVSGEIELLGGIRLGVRELIFFLQSTGVIETYSYEVWQGDNQLYWYDSQPHPNEPSLASTHPHHNHVPPDIKHHRIPAPGLSFTAANLPFLIQEIERELLQTLTDTAASATANPTLDPTTHPATNQPDVPIRPMIVEDPADTCVRCGARRDAVEYMLATPEGPMCWDCYQDAR